MHRLTLHVRILREQALQVASTLSPSSAEMLAAAVTYPSTLSHQTEANNLMSGISASSQKSFLRTMTEYDSLFLLALRRIETTSCCFVAPPKPTRLTNAHPLLQFPQPLLQVDLRHSGFRLAL